MKYYKRMLTTFITISIVYNLLIEIIFLTGYCVFSDYSFKKNANEASVRAMEYTDLRIQSVRQMFQLIRATEFGNKYCAEDITKPDRYSRLKLFSSLKKIHGASPVEIENLAITKLVDDYTIMNDSTGDINFLKKEFSITDEHISFFKEEFTNDQNLPFSFVNTDGDNNLSNIVIAVSDKIGIPHKMYLFAKFSTEQFFDTNQTGTFNLAIRYFSKTIATYGSLDIEEIDSVINDVKKGGFYTVDVPSSVYGISYIYLSAPPNPLLSPTIPLIFILGIIASFISIVIMIKISKQMYNPIERIIDMIGGAPEKGDEISFIQSKYKLLTEQMDNIKMSLYKYNDNARKKLLRDMLLGIISPEDAREQFIFHEIKSEEGIFTPVLIKGVDVAEQSEEMSFREFSELKRILLTLVSDKDEMHSFIEISADTLSLIFTGIDTEKIANMMRSLILTMEPYSGVELYASVGPSCYRIENIYESYRIANRMILHASFDLFKLKVLTPDYIDKIDESYHTLYYPLNIEQSIINGVINFKDELWKTALTEIIDGNKYLTEFSHISLMLSATTSRIADSINKSINDLFPKEVSLYLEFRSCTNINELEKKTIEIFQTLSNQINEMRELSNEGLGNKMKNFIRANYSKNISLYDLADYMNMSRNYVSAVFKNTTGENFKDYLSGVRFNIACDIIKNNPDIKLMVVAEQVGCNSESLARLFLRFCGQTPSDYQKSLNK